MTPNPGTAPRLPALADARAALGLLTRIPAPGAVTGGDLGHAPAFFPAVALLVAGIGVAVRAGTEWLVGATGATVLAVTATVAVTGALHEDGLADTADALWGGGTVDERLAILRDSRLGTYGVVALVLSLVLRIVLLAGLDTADFVRALCLAHAAGGGAGVALLGLLSPVRPDGLGAHVARAVGASATVVAAATVVATAVVTVGAWAAPVLTAAAAATGVVGLTTHRRLGGVTGDVCGAGAQAAHVAVLVAVAALVRHGAL